MKSSRNCHVRILAVIRVRKSNFQIIKTSTIKPFDIRDVNPLSVVKALTSKNCTGLRVHILWVVRWFLWKKIYPRLMYFNLTLLSFSFIRSCLTNVPGNRLRMYMFACSGFEEILHPFKRKIPENFDPFKDKSLANIFVYHANRGSQNSWTDKASHVSDFPIQASLALLQHQLPRGKP